MGALNISARFDESARVVLYEGDTLDLLRTIPDRAVKLVVTSPPYNLGKEYERRSSLDEYLATQRTVIGECYRVLDTDGSLCWQVGNYVNNGEIVPLDMALYPLFASLGLHLRNRIIWHFEHGLHASKRFSGRYETLLWFTKSDNYVFNLNDVRVPAKYPGKRHYKGPNGGKPSGNPLGKNPSDVWQFLADEWQEGFWDIPNVKAKHPEKTIHPCQFPIELAERCVLALTNENDRVLDPYCGVGSSLVAGVMHNRMVIGCDRDPRYTQIAKQRIVDYCRGELKIRPLGKPVYVAGANEKVAKIPEEWLKETKEQQESA